MPGVDDEARMAARAIASAVAQVRVARQRVPEGQQGLQRAQRLAQVVQGGGRVEQGKAGLRQTRIGQRCGAKRRGDAQCLSASLVKASAKNRSGSRPPSSTKSRCALSTTIGAPQA
jgi:hypothetical protein